jgi:hypothetical protein
MSNKESVQKYVSIMWNMLVDPVGVLCTPPDPPNSHINQNSKIFEIPLNESLL